MAKKVSIDSVVFFKICLAGYLNNIGIVSNLQSYFSILCLCFQSYHVSFSCLYNAETVSVVEQPVSDNTVVDR